MGRQMLSTFLLEKSPWICACKQYAEPLFRDFARLYLDGEGQNSVVTATGKRDRRKQTRSAKMNVVLPAILIDAVQRESRWLQTNDLPGTWITCHGDNAGKARLRPPQWLLIE